MFKDRSKFRSNKKLCIRWRGDLRVVKSLSDYVYKVKDLHKSYLDNIHATRFKLYRASEIAQVAIMVPVWNYEKKILLGLVKFENTSDKLSVNVRSEKITIQNDTTKPVARVSNDLLTFFQKLQNR